MGSYYTYFNTAGGPPAVTFSVPYYDLFGLSKFIKFLSLISSFGRDADYSSSLASKMPFLCSFLNQTLHNFTNRSSHKQSQLNIILLK